MINYNIKLIIIVFTNYIACFANLLCKQLITQTGNTKVSSALFTQRFVSLLSVCSWKQVDVSSWTLVPFSFCS